MNKFVFAILSLLLCVFSLDAEIKKYEIFDLGLSQTSTAYCINNIGEVAGIVLVDKKNHVFKWDQSSGISVLFETSGEPIRSINDYGQIVGNSKGGYLWDPKIGKNSLFSKDRNQKNRTLHISHINESGQMTGACYPSGDYYWPRPLLYNQANGVLEIDIMNKLDVSLLDGKYTKTLRGHSCSINNLQCVVGFAEIAVYKKVGMGRLKDHSKCLNTGFLMYHNGDLITFNDLLPIDINDNNDIIFRHYQHDGAMLWNSGEILKLWADGYPNAINNNGDVVGLVDRRNSKAVLWKDGELNYLIDLLGDSRSGWEKLSQAYDINDKGQIVGEGIHNGIRKAFLMTPIDL